MIASTPLLLLTFALQMDPGPPGNVQDNADRTLLEKAGAGSHVAVVVNGQLSELDPMSEKIIRSVDLPPELMQCYGLEEVAGGRLLLASFIGQKVVEIDGTGKVVWEVEHTAPLHATRLSNGNTLVSSYIESRVVEVTPLGKIVNEIKVEGTIWQSQQH